MSDRESFLARWSRRKQAAAGPAGPSADAVAHAPEAAPPDIPSAPPIPGSRPEPEPEPETELPPVDSIDSGTDIRGFLKQGVPPDLTRAALRRAWSSDPVIRDFVGLSENAWDFTVPDGVPGFGSLAADAAQRLLVQGFGPSDTAPGAEPPAAAAAESDCAPGGGDDAGHEVMNTQQGGRTEPQRAAGIHSVARPEPAGEHTAMQQQAAEPESPSGSSGSPGPGVSK